MIHRSLEKHRIACGRIVLVLFVSSFLNIAASSGLQAADLGECHEGIANGAEAATQRVAANADTDCGHCPSIYTEAESSDSAGQDLCSATVVCGFDDPQSAFGLSRLNIERPSSLSAFRLQEAPETHAVRHDVRPVPVTPYLSLSIRFCRFLI